MLTKENTIITVVISLVIITLMGIFVMTGCAGEKYHVDYCGQKICYTNAKDSYKAGTKVVLYFELIATDTDYSFYLDGEPLNINYDEKRGFIIYFVMPEHDVELRCESRNSMEPCIE